MVALAPVPSPGTDPHPPWRDGVVAESPAMRRLLDQVERVAPSTVPVLLQGETGSGKDVLARAIHVASGRRGPLVAVNCAALSPALADSELFGHVRGAFTGAERTRPGLIEQSGRGTLLLDEVGDLDPAIQAKLLCVVEDGVVRRVGSNAVVAVDLRIIAATNRDLAARVAAGAFRADLYHRLAGVTLTLPPLRDRPEDVGPLVRRFLAEEHGAGPVPTVDDLTVACLRNRPWPGNVRELRQVARRATLVREGLRVRYQDFLDGEPPRAAEPSAGDLAWLAGMTWANIERAVLSWAVGRHRGNVRAAAMALGLPRSTLADRMRRRGVEQSS